MRTIQIYKDVKISLRRSYGGWLASIYWPEGAESLAEVRPSAEQALDIAKQIIRHRAIQTEAAKKTNTCVRQANYPDLSV